MKFEKVPGQEKIKDHLLTSIHNKKLSHAYMFVESEGGGALAIALALSQYLLCENPSETDSCGICPSCQKVEKLIHPDLHFSFPAIKSKNSNSNVSTEYINVWRKTIPSNPFISYFDWMQELKAENKQGNISIEECHAIIKRLSLKSYEGGAKIQIVWLAEYLGKNGNSLLKIIEEPSPNTFFIFITQNKEYVLNTILSRTQVLLFPPVKSESISKYLIDNKLVGSEKADYLANLSNGNFTECLRLIKAEHADHAENFIKWMRMCFHYDPLAIGNWLNSHVSNGREYLKDFIKYGMRIIRESFLSGQNLEELNHLSANEVDFAKNFSKFISVSNLETIYKLLNESYYMIERNANPRILFFNISLRFNKILNNQQ